MEKEDITSSINREERILETHLSGIRRKLITAVPFAEGILTDIDTHSQSFPTSLRTSLNKKPTL